MSLFLRDEECDRAADERHIAFFEDEECVRAADERQSIFLGWGGECDREFWG